MTDPVARLNTALEGRYRVESELGEGGMANVYLADDLKHDRKVAIKVLKPELAAVVGAERFLAEIKTTANLQHPNILPLFDSGQADSFLFYVMPYVEGESLQDKLNRERQLPVDEAVSIASEVADALEAAHEAGVVHRDIKPANILLSRGRPLVADFGIALAVTGAAGTRLTETGLSVGTPHYMSPEQATGEQHVGPAADTYALGCVLYEMLVGEPPYTGATAQAILGRIIMGGPASATEHRSSVPAHVDAAIRKALEKLPADRFSSAQKFVSALGDGHFRHGELLGAGAAASAARWSRLTVVFGLVALFASALATWGWLQLATAPVPQVQRFAIEMDDIELYTVLDEIVISPDGRRLAVVGLLRGTFGLYWRNIDEEAFRFVAGFPSNMPAFSPDGEWLAYVTNSGIVRVSLSGGEPEPVGGVAGRGGLSWGGDDNIVFARSDGVYQVRVPWDGGEPSLLLDASWAVNPRLLPGGRHLLLTDDRNSSTVLLDLETDSVRELVPGGIDAMYVESGHLLWVDLTGGLWQRPFDPSQGQFVGPGSLVFDGLRVMRETWASYTVSATGTLVYTTMGGQQLKRLLVVDMEGNAQEPPLRARPFDQVRWSPDGRSIVYSQKNTESTGDIFVYNVELGTEPRQLTFGGRNSFPIWAPDGTRVAYTSPGDDGGRNIFVKSVNDDSPPALLGAPTGYPYQWMGDTLIFSPPVGVDIWVHDVSSSDSLEAREYLSSEALLSNARISPSGDLAAYGSNESGTFEIYVRSFPEAGRSTRVSQGGGGEPRWSPDGNTIYYWTLGPDGSVITLMAAHVTRGPRFVVTSREVVLEGPYAWNRSRNWDLHPDGNRFVVTQAVDEPPTPERHLVVLNFFEVLKERVGN